MDTVTTEKEEKYLLITKIFGKHKVIECDKIPEAIKKRDALEKKLRESYPGGVFHSKFYLVEEIEL